jgi:hypothetical protein
MQHQSEMLHPASPTLHHHRHRHMSLEDSILASSPERHHIEHHAGEILSFGGSSSSSANLSGAFDPSSIPHLDLEMVDQPSIATSCPSGLDLQARVDLTTHMTVPDFEIRKSRVVDQFLEMEDSVFDRHPHEHERMEGRHNSLLEFNSSIPQSADRLEVPAQSYSDSEGDVIVDCGVRENPSVFMVPFEPKPQPHYASHGESSYHHHPPLSLNERKPGYPKHSNEQVHEAEVVMALDVSQNVEGVYSNSVPVKPEYANHSPRQYNHNHMHHGAGHNSQYPPQYGYGYQQRHNQVLPATVISGPHGDHYASNGIAPPPPPTLAAQVVGSAPIGSAYHHPSMNAISIPSAEQGGFIDLPGDFDRMDLRYIGIYDDVVKKPLDDDVGKLIRVWSGERNRLYYDCMCKKRKPIKNLKAIASHAKRHKQDTTSMEVYTCDKCGRVFAHYLGLNSHQRVHRIQGQGDPPPMTPSRYPEEEVLDHYNQVPSGL